MLSAGIAAVVAVVYGSAVVGLAAPHDHGMPFPVWVALFALAEIFVVHFEFRRDAHTFSLVEIPLVLGLLYASPALLLPAHVLGAAAALTVYRRQTPIKLVFNLAAFALETCFAVLVFRALVATPDPVTDTTWLAASVAALAASLTSIIAVFGAIALSGGEQTRTERLQALGFGLGASLVNTSVALAIAVLAEENGLAILLLAPPIVAIYVAYRFHGAQRTEQRRLEFLQESTGLLHRSSNVNWALDALLDRARTAFQADVAALTYVPAGEVDSVALIVLGPGNEHRSLTAIPGAAAWDEWSRIAADDGRFVDDDGSLISGLPLRDGVVVALEGETGVIGHLLVANRLSDVSRFTDAHRQLLTTMAQHLSVGLDKGVLEQSVHHQRVLERQLEYRATHDALTGLGNQTLFLDRVAARMAAGNERGTAAVIAIEITHTEPPGPPVPPDSDDTDKLYVVVAERLRRCLRPADVVARLDGRRFGILTAAPTGVEDARRVADRVRDRLTAPVFLDNARVDVTVRIGFELSTAADDAGAVVERAFSARAADAPEPASH